MNNLQQIIYEETGFTESDTPDKYAEVAFACYRFAAHAIVTANFNTADTALMKQALEALEHAERDVADFQCINTDQTGAIITALRARLGLKLEASND